MATKTYYKPKQTGTDKLLELRAYGPEPDGGTDFTAMNDLIGALNWYSHQEINTDTGQEWLFAEMLKHDFTPKQISAVRRSGKTMPTDYAIARLLSRECNLGDDVVGRWKKRMADYAEFGRYIQEQRAADRKSEAPAERNKRKALSFVADFDNLLDDIWVGKVKIGDINFFEQFRSFDIKPSQAGMLVDYFKDYMKRIEADVPYLETKADKANYKQTKTFLELLVESLDAWSGSSTEKKEPKRRGRKPGVRKPIALATRLKYKRQDDDTKLVSAEPRGIIGASMVVLYNAKYKQLTILRAGQPEGLSIKGTTILNVDETGSDAKRAGRHVNDIKSMTTAPKTQIAKMFAAINSTSIEVRTRTSEDTIIVRVIK